MENKINESSTGQGILFHLALCAFLSFGIKSVLHCQSLKHTEEYFLNLRNKFLNQENICKFFSKQETHFT